LSVAVKSQFVVKKRLARPVKFAAGQLFQRIDKIIDSDYNNREETIGQVNPPHLIDPQGLEPEEPIYIPPEDYEEYDFHELSEDEIDSLVDGGYGSKDESILDGWAAKSWTVSWGSLFWKLEYVGSSTKCWPTSKVLYLWAKSYYKAPGGQNYALKKVGGPSESSRVYVAYVWLYRYSKSHSLN